MDLPIRKRRLEESLDDLTPEDIEQLELARADRQLDDAKDREVMESSEVRAR